MKPIEFLAEVKSTNSRKTASLDVEHKITFVTENPDVLELSKLPGDTLFKVRVEVFNGS